MHTKRETTIGCGIIGGLGLLVFGYVVGFMGLGGSVARSAYTQGSDSGPVAVLALGIIMMVAGALSVVGSIVYGFVHLRQSSTATPVNHPDVLVVARFATNEIGEMVFSDFDPEDPYTKLFVHLKFPGGRNGEFRCRVEVFDQCCEGFRGSAIVKGDWLGGFSPFAVQPSTPLL